MNRRSFFAALAGAPVAMAAVAAPSKPTTATLSLDINTEALRQVLSDVGEVLAQSRPLIDWSDTYSRIMDVSGGEPRACRPDGSLLKTHPLGFVPLVADAGGGP